MRRMRKKGSLDDIVFLLIMGFILSVSIVIPYMIYTQINTAMQASPDISTGGKSIMQNFEDKYVPVFDYFFITIFVLLAVVSLILASQVDVSPIFAIASIFLFFVIIFVSAIVGNTYYNLMADATLSIYAEDFTIIPFMMNNIVVIMLSLGFLISVVLYA